MSQSFRELLGVKPSEASTEDSVLLIIDAQNEYIDGKLKTANFEKTREAIETVARVFRSSWEPKLVHIVHKTSAEAPIFTTGTPLEEEFDELFPNAWEKVITKEHPGAFTGTDLDAWLKEQGRKKVVLVGYMAHVCVSTTARQAAELGYDVILVEEAIGDRDIPGATGEEVTAMVLKELGDAFGTVVKVGSIF